MTDPPEAVPHLHDAMADAVACSSANGSSPARRRGMW